MNKLGKTIRILRQAKELKLSELAKKSAISVPFLSLLEKGTRQPSLDVIRRLSVALGVPSEALVLLGLGSTTMSSADQGVVDITDSIRNLIAVEDKLKEVLKSKESASESERSHGKGRRRRSASE